MSAREAWRRSRRTALLGAALGAALLGGCEIGTAPGGGGTGGEGLTGVLVDGGGAPVRGAKVRVFRDPTEGGLAKAVESAAESLDSTLTDSTGRFRFPRLRAGRYNVESSWLHGDTVYARFVRDVELRRRLTLGIDTLKPSGSLYLSVRGGDGSPREGAECAVAGSPWAARSDAQGVCALEQVAPGGLEVLVSDGAVPVRVAAEVRSGKEAREATVLPEPRPDMPSGRTLSVEEGHSFLLPQGAQFTSAGSSPVYKKAVLTHRDLVFETYAGVYAAYPPGASERAAPDSRRDTVVLDALTLGIAVYFDQPAADPRAAKAAVFRVFERVGDTLLVPRLRFEATGATQEDIDRATQIFLSVRNVIGPLGPPPPAPVILGPSNDSTVGDTLLLRWSVAAGTLATGHAVELSEDSLFLKPFGVIGGHYSSMDLVPMTGEARVNLFLPRPKGATGAVFARVLLRGPTGVSASETRRYFASGPAPGPP